MDQHFLKKATFTKQQQKVVKKNGRFRIEDWLLTCDEANKINATF